MYTPICISIHVYLYILIHYRNIYKTIYIHIYTCTYTNIYTNIDTCIFINRYMYVFGGRYAGEPTSCHQDVFLCLRVY